MEEKNYFIELNSIDVNDKVEKKNGLTYLSWAYAWGEVKKRYPDANYKVYEDFNGCIYFNDGRTAWVKTGVIINGIEHIEYLPIMDYKNKSIPLEQITSFDVNKTIQRSLTKAVARHGLGLYIYAGEDLPETPEKTSENKPPKVETKENKAEDKKQDYDFKKDIEKALKNDKQVVSDNDLPFTDIKDEVDKFAIATENLFKANEEREIDVLEHLRDLIASKLYELGNKDLTQAYGYYAKNYKKATFEDLNESELQEIVKRLDAKLIARKEAQ